MLTSTLHLVSTQQQLLLQETTPLAAPTPSSYVVHMLHVQKKVVFLHQWEKRFSYLVLLLLVLECLKFFWEGGNCILAAHYGALCDCGIYFYCPMHNETAQWCLCITWNMHYFRNVSRLHIHTKGHCKGISMRFLENPFYYKQMHLFGLFIIGLLFGEIFPSPECCFIAAECLLGVP